MTAINGKNVLLSRFLLGIEDNQRVVYLNHDTLDLRKSNLKIASRQELTFHSRKRKGCSSQYKGVYWNKYAAKWRSLIARDGKRYHLGYFDDETDAARAYDAAAQEWLGELAYLNFPENPPTQLAHSTRPAYSGLRKSKTRTYTSSYKGVSYSPKDGWRGQFIINGQRLYRRTDTEMEAVAFYDAMILRHRGSNARANFESIWARKRRERLNAPTAE